MTLLSLPNRQRECQAGRLTSGEAFDAVVVMCRSKHFERIEKDFHTDGDFHMDGHGWWGKLFVSELLTFICFLIYFLAVGNWGCTVVCRQVGRSVSHPSL